MWPVRIPLIFIFTNQGLIVAIGVVFHVPISSRDSQPELTPLRHGQSCNHISFKEDAVLITDKVLVLFKVLFQFPVVI